jgi:hypothetical protein
MVIVAVEQDAQRPCLIRKTSEANQEPYKTLAKSLSRMTTFQKRAISSGSSPKHHIDHWLSPFGGEQESDQKAGANGTNRRAEPQTTGKGFLLYFQVRQLGLVADQGTLGEMNGPLQTAKKRPRIPDEFSTTMVHDASSSPQQPQQ